MQHSSLTKTLIALSLFLLLLSWAAACQTQPTPAADTRATDEATLRNLDMEWSKAAGAKDVDKTVSFYSDDAEVLPQNSSVIKGKGPIHALWKGMLGSQFSGGGWKPTKVEVARSGDLAYVSGAYEFNETDANGKPIVDKGKYLEVWKKQPDGNWKCVADIFNTDLPAAAPTTQTKAAAGEKTK